MPDCKFQIGDIVRCTPEGNRYGAAGRGHDRLEVIHCHIGEFEGRVEYMIRVRPPEGIMLGRWREKWYELVEPKDGPW